MDKSTENKQWPHLLAGVALIASFFFPWVKWEGIPISGYSLPAGEFFSIADTKFGLANPFPQFSFSFYAFWLVPALAAVTVLLSYAGKKTGPFSYIAGTLSLALVVVFIMFSTTLIDLGVGTSIYKMLTPWIYVQALSAILLIFTTFSPIAAVKKMIWLLLGPVFAFGSYLFIKDYLEKETFGSTKKSKADFTISALALISEFAVNNDSAKTKYKDKVLIVNGRVSEIEAADTTMNIKFIDTTSGSYAIFTFQEQDLAEVKKISIGDSVSIKGVFSDGVFSQLRKITSISFIRSTLNK